LPSLENKISLNCDAGFAALSDPGYIFGNMDSIIETAKIFYNRAKYRRYGWHGDYANWQDARNACTGYDAAAVLDKVKQATLKVKTGEAVYERDGMLFDHIEYSWPLLANLLRIAAKKNGELSVIDFGGSLGSSWFQNRYYLNSLRSVQWNVIEQPHYVISGNREIADERLRFFNNIREALDKRGPADILLFSCSLPYLESPYTLLEEVAGLHIPYIIVDNTYFNPGRGNRLTIQKVPPVYYDASYPAWFLDYQQVLFTLNNEYDMFAAHTNDQILYLNGKLVRYRGFTMKLKTIT